MFEIRNEQSCRSREIDFWISGIRTIDAECSKDFETEGE